MAKLLKLRRGTTTQHGSFTGAEGEVTVDTDKETLVVHDGSTAGGHPVAAEDMANVSSANILSRINTGAIAGTKLENSGVTAGQYGSSSAIPIVTVDAQGLVTAASTTAIDSTTIANGTSNVAVANNGDITATRSGTARLVVGSAGAAITGNLDVSAGVDVTGNITTTSGSLTVDGIGSVEDTFKITDSAGTQYLLMGNQDSAGTNSPRVFKVGNAQLEIGTGDSWSNNTGGTFTNHFSIAKNGQITSIGNHDFNSGIDVTGDITCTGTVDGKDISALGITGTVLANGVTATTQAQSDNSTKVSTTAYVRTAISEAQAFPSGTKMLFQQTAAPTGWTKQTSGVDNKALRVVSGTAGSGGSNAFSNTLASRSITANSANATQGGNISVANTTAGGNVSIDSASTGGTVNSHTLTINEIPSHSHNIGLNQHRGTNTNYRNNQAGLAGVSYINVNTRNYTSSGSFNTSNSGGGGGHSHGFTGGSHNHNGTLSGTAHTHNATFTGSAHNHSISVTNLDMAVQYLDVIIAAKD